MFSTCMSVLYIHVWFCFFFRSKFLFNNILAQYFVFVRASLQSLSQLGSLFTRLLSIHPMVCQLDCQSAQLSLCHCYTRLYVVFSCHIEWHEDDRHVLTCSLIYHILFTAVIVVIFSFIIIIIIRFFFSVASMALLTIITIIAFVVTIIILVMVWYVWLSSSREQRWESDTTTDQKESDRMILNYLSSSPTPFTPSYWQHLSATVRWTYRKEESFFLSFI